MVRPCFLVVDREHSGSISTRKLVIETAKFNVITAYSGAEAIETLKAFPNVSGVIIDAGVRDMTCSEAVAGLRSVRPNLPMIGIGAPRASDCGQLDYFMDSFEPGPLLALLQKLEPEKTSLIKRQDDQLKDAEN